MSYKFGARRASDITAGTFADGRISSGSVTQHESALESALDLNQLNVAGNTALGANHITTTDATTSNYASSTGSLVPYAVVNEMIDAKISGLDWQSSASDRVANASKPGSPSAGDRVLITDDGSANENKIATYDGSSWTYIAPSAGMSLYIEDEDKIYVYKDDSTKWALIGTFISGALQTSNNLSDLASASTARTNLGLAIGSDVQAFDAQLSDVAGLTPADGKFIVGDGSNFVAESGATARTSLGLGSLSTASAVNNDNWSGTDLAIANGGTGASTASGARTALGLAIGSDVQAYDAQLAGLAGLSPGNYQYISTDGSGNFEMSSKGVFTGPLYMRQREVSADYTVDSGSGAGDYIIFVDIAGGNVVVTLPASDGDYVAEGRQLIIKTYLSSGSTTSNYCHIEAASGDKIDGSTDELELDDASAYQAVTLQLRDIDGSDDLHWTVI